MGAGSPAEKGSAVTFGLRLPTSGPLVSTEAVIEAADAAEELGYDSVWTNDHISWTPERITHFSAGSIEAVSDQDPDFFESLCTLAYIAGRTRRIRLVVSVLVLPLRDPRVLARQALTIDALSGGRLTLAISVGAIRNDFDVMEVAWNRRGRIANEYLAALDAALGDATLSKYHGDIVEFDGAGFFPKPTDLRKWIAGVSPAAFRRIARWADGWLVSQETPEAFAAQRQELHAVLAKAGRSEDSITCANQVWISVQDSYEEALGAIKPTLEHRFSGRPGSLDRAMKASIVGDPQQAVEQIRTHMKAGVNSFGLKIVARSMEQYLANARRIAEDVIPNVT